LYSGEEVAKEFGSIKAHGYFMRLLAEGAVPGMIAIILTLLIAFLTIIAAISAGPLRLGHVPSRTKMPSPMRL
jgi:hypothetical protein